MHARGFLVPEVGVRVPAPQPHRRDGCSLGGVSQAVRGGSEILAPMADVVRTPIGPDARLPTRRTMDERLFIRWPGLYAALSQAVNRLPPRSRIRRTLLRRAVLSSFGAVARRDIELWLLRWAPDCQLDLLPELTAAGMRTSYHGYEGLRELMADWADAWERIDLKPQEILDAGNPAVCLGHFRVRGRGSGVDLHSTFAFVWWAKRGLVVRQRDLSDWDEALRVAGIGASCTPPRKRAPKGAPN
jgi:ketosteroid isomerase-like protein